MADDGPVTNDPIPPICPKCGTRHIGPCPKDAGTDE